MDEKNPTPDAGAKKAKERPAAEKPTPEKHAAATGNVRRKRSGVAVLGGAARSGSKFSARHRAADVKHGWSKQLRKTGKAFELSESDYLEALKAVGVGNAHDPALAPVRRIRRAQ